MPLTRLPLAALTALLLVLLPGAQGTAQTYPDYTSTTVNDFADLLPEAQERALSDRLARLERDTGVELAVVTLPTQGDYAPTLSLAEFAMGLFNDWGIGKAASNDGVLILILRDDRAMRIELGAAYARAWDGAAARVVDGVFLPAFRNDDYATGILDGTEAAITQIVMPFREGAEAPGGGGGIGDLAIFAGFFGVFVLLAGRRWIGDRLVRLRACPNCGHKGLSRSRTVLTNATRTMSGTGERVTRCSQCGYEDRSTYVIPRRGRSSGGSFGGGSSGGGGASGRW